MSEKLKSSTIHKILKSLSPRRTITSEKLGTREIPRSITEDGLKRTTNFFNNLLKEFTLCCEESLKEINQNPNSYYQTHRYNELVVEKAIRKLKSKLI